jgi:hypothetical protein
MPLTGTAVVALPDDLRATLALAADDQALDVEVQALGADGKVTGSRSVAVASGHTTTLPVGELARRGAAALLLHLPEGAAGLHAAVTLQADAEAGDELVSVLVVRPPTAPPAAVTVRPVRDNRWP